MSTARQRSVPGHEPRIVDPAQAEAPYLEACRPPGRDAPVGGNAELDPLLALAVAELETLSVRDEYGLLTPALARAEELAAHAWGARDTWFLTGGSGEGLQAASLALAAGGSAVVQGNVSIGAVHGLVLSGVVPTVIEPAYDDALGIAHCVSAESLDRALADAPEATAAIIASPTCLGAVADLAELARVAHARGAALVVDETWGAHFAFHPALPDHALSAGADLVVTGGGETLGGLTQTAMLHLGVGAVGRVEVERLTRALALVGSGEQSPALLASLDAARRAGATRGTARLEQALAGAEAVRRALGGVEGLEVVAGALSAADGVADVDPLRVVIDVRATGASGHHVRQALERSAFTRPELATDELVALPTGFSADPAPDAALVAEEVERAVAESVERGVWRRRFARPPSRGPLAMTPREASLAPHEVVPIRQAAGRIAAQALSVQPAGTVTVLPGERVSDATRAFVERTVKQGAPVIGATDAGGATVLVVAAGHDPGASSVDPAQAVLHSPNGAAPSAQTAGDTPAHAAFEDFPARAYLEKYYSGVGPENDALLGTLIDYIATMNPPTGRVIEVAGGPSLFSMLALAAVRGEPFEQVLFTDLGRENLAEVERWLTEEPACFDYAHLLDWLEHRTGAAPASVCAAARASDWQLASFDWKNDPPPEWCGRFDVVSSHFFAESATANEEEFVTMMRRLPRLGRPGALVLMSFMSRSQGYTIDGAEYPGFDVDETTLLAYFREAGVSLEDLFLRTVAAEDPASDPGYEGLLFVAGRLAGVTEPGA